MCTMSRIANFIDGGYFQVLLRDQFKQAKIDFKLLAQKMAGGREILRTYFYDCLPYQSVSPTHEEKERFARRQRFHYSLSQNPRFQIRLGQLEYRGMNTN